MARKQVIVIGLGRFGSNVTRTLYQHGHDVLAIDTEETLVQEVMGYSTYAVKADGTNEAVLRELGVDNFDAAVMAIGSNILASILGTVLLKSLGVPYIVTRARNHLHGQTLEKVGADHVVYPEQETGVRTARSLFNPDVTEYMELGPSFGLSKIKAGESLKGFTLKEAGIAESRDRYSLSVLAIHRGRDVIILPSEEEKIQLGDELVISGTDVLIEKLHLDHTLQSKTNDH